MSAERVILPAPVRAKRHVQTPAEAQREYDAVTARDKDCQAPLIDPTCDPCSGRLTREHVRYSAAMGGRRLTVRTGMLILCTHHHLDGWATSHKQAERDWLAGGKA
jgi:hypothetical protein